MNDTGSCLPFPVRHKCYRLCGSTAHTTKMFIMKAGTVGFQFQCCPLYLSISYIDNTFVLVLSINICFYFSEDVNDAIIDSAVISELFDEYVNALVYHMDKTRPQPREMMVKIVYGLTEMRTSSHLYHGATCYFMKMFPEIELSDLFKELKCT